MRRLAFACTSIIAIACACTGGDPASPHVEARDATGADPTRADGDGEASVPRDRSNLDDARGSGAFVDAGARDDAQSPSPSPTQDAEPSPVDAAPSPADAAPLPPPACDPPGVRLSIDVQPIFDASCTSCHGADATAGLDLRASQARTSLVGVPANQCSGVMRVAAGDASASYLVDAITGQQLCGGQRMPKGGAPLASQQVKTIVAWICGGAQP